jgi:hypothetical protein
MTKLYFTKSLNKDDLQWKMTSNGRQHLIEDVIKMFKVEYLCNHLLDHTRILNLSFNDQAIFYTSFK